MNLVSNTGFDAAAAANVIAGELATATVHLGQVNQVIDRNTTKADLTPNEADFDGYAAGTVTWLTPSIADDGNVEVVGTVPEFRPTGSTTPNSIYTLWVLSAVTGTPLCFAAMFDNAPLGMGSTSDSILVTLRFRPQNGGLVVVIS